MGPSIRLRYGALPLALVVLLTAYARPGAFAPPVVSVIDVNAGASIERELCVTIAIGAGAASECGDLRLVHGLPAARTLSRERAPTLLYNSDHASPYAIVRADVTLSGGTAGLSRVTAKLLVNGAPRAESVWKGSNWPSAGPKRVAVGFDAQGETTNVYRYELHVTATYGAVSETTVAKGELVIVNRKDNYFGAGWWLAGLERLVRDPFGNPTLWIAGDGSTRRYLRVNDSTWSAVALDRPDTLKKDGTQYVRFLPGGVKVYFDSLGQHVSTRSRLGHETVFAYDASGRLDRITVPFAPADYVFRYDLSGKLRTVESPYTSGTTRNTSVFVSQGRVDSIVDPDLTRIAFAYFSASSRRITARTDRRGVRTTYAYDAAWKVASSKLRLSGSDSIYTRLRSAEGIGLLTAADTIAIDTALAYTRLDGPRTDVADTTLFWTDRFGSPWRVRDAAGAVTVAVRGDSRFPALVTEITDAAGVVSRAWYDGRGNVDSTKVEDPYGDSRNAVTTYEWNSTWDAVTRIELPEGEVTTFGYDATNGNRRWQQPGSDSARRVRFSYENSFGLLSSVQAPDIAGKDSLEYDSRGNLLKARTPRGQLTEYAGDAIGRDTLVRNQVDSVNFAHQRAVYDVVDQVVTSVSYGPAIPRVVNLTGSPPALADSVTVTTEYDAEGNVLQVLRDRGRAYTDEEPIPTAFSYDSAGRKVSENLTGNVERYVYDPAGNVIRWITPRGDTIKSRYDAAGRMIERVVPQVSYASTACGVVIGTTCFYSFPEREGSTLVIAADTSTFAYDSVGRMARADNGSARVRRSYYRSGALASDTLRIRKYAKPSAGMGTDSDYTAHVYPLSFTYDLNGRRKTFAHPDVIDPCVGAACPPESYAYHAETGALASLTDILGGSHSFSYDNSGRLVTRNAPGGVSDAYTYDSDDNLIRHVVNTVNQGALTDSSSYDLRGKVRYVNSAALRGTAELNLSYTGLGAVSGFTNTGVAGGFPVEEFITDGLGNRTERKQSGGANDPFDPNRHRRFFYDSWNRLYEMDSPSADPLQFEHRETYQYDGAGNTRYSYVFERPSTGWKLIHDASASYYGADNKLRVYNRHIGQSEFSDDSTAGRRGTFDEYRYDALGRRVLTRTRRLGFGCEPVFVDCESVATRTVWDGDRILYEIRAPGGELVTQQGDTVPSPYIESDSYTGGPAGLTYGRVAYTHAPGVTGIDEPIAITRIGSTSQSVPDPMTVYPHTGWRGMLAVGTMSNGYVSDCGYSGSGTCAPIDWPAIDATVDRGPSASNEPQSWFGGLASAYSEGSGLSYKRNRFYDPNRGQFTQADPIGLAGGLNVYGFADGDPVNFDDPFGLCPWCVAYAVFEIGSTVVDVADLGVTVLNRVRGRASNADVAVTAAGVVAGVAGFGGGYGRAARSTARIADGASDWPKLSGMLRDAARGKGDFGIGAATREQADAMGRAWVGKGFTVASDGRTLVSSNKLRQYRPPTYKPKEGRVQANLQWRADKKRAWQGNAHVDINGQTQ